MTHTEHQLRINLDKAQNGQIKPELYNNEINRLQALIESETAPLRAAGQGNYYNYLLGFLNEFKALRPPEKPPEIVK